VPGPAGSTGATGATGVVGATTVVTGTVVSIPANSAFGATFLATASCPAGQKAISGGGTVTNTAGTGKQVAAMTESRPTTLTTNPTGWTATATVVSPNDPGGGSITAYVVCA
jgi:hypothetical protein